jgi:hypothetical protein
MLNAPMRSNIYFRWIFTTNFAFANNNYATASPLLQTFFSRAWLKFFDDVKAWFCFEHMRTLENRCERLQARKASVVRERQPPRQRPFRTGIRSVDPEDLRETHQIDMSAGRFSGHPTLMCGNCQNTHIYWVVYWVFLAQIIEFIYINQ